jgi:hypothetical protein
MIVVVDDDDDDDDEKNNKYKPVFFNYDSMLLRKLKCKRKKNPEIVTSQDCM